MINSPRTNLFGDVDERDNSQMEDEDLREGDVDLRRDREPIVTDIDHRISLPMQMGMGGQPLPPGEEPVPPFLPPPGLRVPFIPTSTQPPPPGLEWEHPLATSVPVVISGVAPVPGEWLQPPLPEVSQPPLPAEPPKPKPPEPPIKKKRPDDDFSKGADEGSDDDSRSQSKNSKKKKKKKAKKDKKGGQVMSDQRLKQIVLEIAKKEPIEPPPLPPTMVPGMRQMPFVPPPQSMMPMVPPMVVPEVSGVMPIMSSAMQGPSMINNSWMEGRNVGPGINAMSQMMPPNQPPHMQPGVAPGPLLPLPGIEPGLHPPGIQPPMNFRDRPNRQGHPKVRPPKEFAKKPPSLLDMPTLQPAPSLLAKNPEMASGSASGSGSNSPSIRDDVSFDAQEGHDVPASERDRDHDERSHERDRDERERHHRSRSGDRHHRSRSGSRSYRSRSRDRESSEHRHGDRSQGRSHYRHRDHSRDRDSRDRRDRDRDRRHRNSRH